MSGGSKKSYSIWDFMKFTMPFIWKGGLIIRIQTILTFVLLITSRVLTVIHPLILKMVIDDITLSETYGNTSTYYLIGWYALTRFSAEFVNYIREVPFANVSASAETHIAHMVYNHI